MALRHGRTRYTRGCRCNVCKAAERDYQRNRYRHRRGLPVDPPEHPPLSVVSAEGHVMLARSNPRWQPNWPLYALPPTGRALAQAALALARILDNPRAVSSQPAAARVLGTLLDELSVGAWTPGRLAVVRAMRAGDQ
jgi:hypothetical protein